MRAASLILVLSLALGACGDGGGFSLGAEAQIDISPQVLEFSDVPRGGEALRVVTVRHVGSSGLIRLDPVTLETASSDLTIESIERTELLPGQESRIRVLYTSRDDAPDTGDLVIGLNVGATPELRVPVTTPGQRGRLIATPGTLDFGVVQAGAPGRIPLTITNVGTAPATLTSGVSVGDDDGDFSVELTPGTVVDAGSAVVVTAVYSPTGGDSDKGELQILTEREDVSVAVPVEGEEQTPILVVEPSIAQFGWVQPGGALLRTIKMRNEGNTDLTVNHIALLDQHQSIGLVDTPQPPFVLEPGDEKKFGALFQPLEEIPMTGNPIGRIVVESTDEANNPLEVPIFGAAGIPGINVNPPDVVDFAFVAEGFVARRTVTIINVGTSAVTVTDARLAEQTSDEFGLANPEVLPATINPGETVTIELTFENTSGDSGTEFARLLLNTTDPLVPEYPLDVVARRSERPTCEPAFVPNILAMGALRATESKIDEIQLVNFGSGNCDYQRWEIVDCRKEQIGPRHRFDCDPTFSNSPFSVVDAPAQGERLGPGGSLTFGVRFDAPNIFNTTLGRDQYFGRLAVIMHDPNTDLPKLAAPEGGWGKGYNLSGESALPVVQVDPPAIDFGLVRNGCESAGQVVTISNLGPLEAQVTGIDTSDCGGEIVLKNVPSMPFLVGGFQQFYLEVAFAPTEGVAQTCDIVITNDSANLPVAQVTLGGGVVDVQHHTDTFLQSPTPRVDVLFVVDDSFSMSDEQLLLAEEIPNLVQVAAQWGQDYHMAVTTTDDITVRGKFKGSPPYATVDDDLAAFSENLLVGITGHYEEKGLEGAWLALSGGNVASTEFACVDAPNACPQNFRCIEGFCRGPNWGFLRPDADLVIIIISDEEDSSPQSPDWYVTRLAALKGQQSGFGVKLHAIVNTPAGCFGEGWGSPGTRYIQAANAFQGHVANICATDFGAEFESISQKTFGLKDQFHPSLPVDSTTLQVRVNGAACDDGWSWNPNTGAVVFEEGGSCFPPLDAQIEVEYDVLCQSFGN